MTANELQSKTIDFVRFPLACAVVVIHANGAITYGDITPGVEVYNTLSWIFVKLISTIAVPLFFAISGYLYFFNVQEWNKSQYLRKSKSRIKTLLIPFLIWNAIGLLGGIAKGIFLYKTQGELTELMQQLNSITGWIKPFWAQWPLGPMQDIVGNNFMTYYPYTGALWFLRDLIGACIISPFIYLFVKYTKVWGLLLLAVANYTNIWIHIPGFGIEVVFYFSLGAYFGINKKNMVEIVSRFRATFAILWILFFTLSVIPLGIPIPVQRLITLSFIFTGGITVLNIASYLLDKKKVKENKSLTQTTFFIFVSHGYAIVAVGLLFQFIFSYDSIAIRVLQFFTIPTLAILLCILVYHVAKKIAPKILSVFVGSR